MVSKAWFYIEKSFDDNIRGSTRESTLNIPCSLFADLLSGPYTPCQIDYAINFESIEVCIKRGLPWYEPWVTFADSTAFLLPRVNMYSCIAHNLERLRNLQCKNQMKIMSFSNVRSIKWTFALCCLHVVSSFISLLVI